MILPSKHIKLSESLIGIGALILESLNKPMTLEQSWKKFNKNYMDTGIIKKKFNIDVYIDAIMLLYMLGALDIDKHYMLNCTNNDRG
ncbi:ABC-three component system middle component 6 [Clostridium sp.]|uniref:ABC-three component system middle component 6 n=1 Tax=Clostridium sp. TaxID=1506 RepID=UPI003F660DDE